MSVTATLAPCLAKAKQWDFPIPLLAPVTKAALFLSSNIISLFYFISKGNIGRDFLGAGFN